MRLALRTSVSLLLLATLHTPCAFGAQTDITISTAAAPAVPRILGPSIIGFKPGSPLLYTLPATGQAPLTFSATGLPSGLAIDASSGSISGTTPAAGSYPFTVTLTNGAGSTTAQLTLVAGATLALTPPMGWNSYDSFGATVKESEFLAAAKAMKGTLAAYGWNTVVIDYLWYDSEQKLDASGRWLPSPSKWPSATGDTGFKSVADQIHALGLNFGIHLMRGIPRKAVTANSAIANSTYTATQAGNTSDTCSWDNHMYGVKGDTDAGKAWYDSIYAQYAAWGVDFVKVDDMMNPYGGNVLHTAEVQAVAAAIAKTGRSIILSLSPGPNQTKDVAPLNVNANMWRTVNDFWDTSGLSNLSNEFDAAYNWSATAGVTPGHWPDADMLPLGFLGPRCPAHGSGNTALSHNEQVMVMTLWSIMPSPLMFGGNPSNLSGDTWTIALLTNEEVLAVNQDALGARGKRIAKSGTTEVWAKELSGGRKAVALFNRGTQDATIAATFAQLGVSGTVAVRDLWRRADVPGATTEISANVPHESALMYTLTPPGSTGGASGAGGTSGTGGSPSQTGGTSGRGGSSAADTASTSVPPGSGGAQTTGGTSNTAVSGGRGSTGGHANTGGTLLGFGGSVLGEGGGSSPAAGAGTAHSGGQLGAGGSNGTGGLQTQPGTTASSSSAVTAFGGSKGTVTASNASASAESGGCTCRVTPGSNKNAAWLAVFGAVLLARGRRRFDAKAYRRPR